MLFLSYRLRSITSLRVAVYFGISQLALEFPLDSDLIISKDCVKWNALAWSAYFGHLPVVKLLVAHDTIDVCSQDDKSRTVLSRAAEKGNIAVVKLILNHNSDTSMLKVERGWIPLSWATKEGQESVVKLLLDHNPGSISE